MDMEPEAHPGETSHASSADLTFEERLLVALRDAMARSPERQLSRKASPPEGGGLAQVLKDRLSE
jgi:hypothetical protein